MVMWMKGVYVVQFGLFGLLKTFLTFVFYSFSSLWLLFNFGLSAIGKRIEIIVVSAMKR